MARFQHRIWNEWLTTFTSWWILYPSDDLDYLDDSFSMSSGLVFRFIDMFEMWALDVSFFFVDPRKNCASLSQYNCRTASIYRHPPAVPHSQTGLVTNQKRTKKSSSCTDMFIIASEKILLLHTAFCRWRSTYNMGGTNCTYVWNHELGARHPYPPRIPHHTYTINCTPVLRNTKTTGTTVVYTGVGVQRFIKCSINV